MNPDSPRFTTLVATVSLVACAVLGTTAGAAYAAGPVTPTLNLGAVTQTLNVAVLTPCCGNPEPAASGVAQSNTLSKPGVGTANIFSSTVTLPKQSSSISSADIRVVLSRASQNYAECSLIPVPIETDSNDEPNTQTFLVSIVKVVTNSGTIFLQLAGKCDVDLATDGIQPGIPPVLTGDVATAVSVVNSVPTNFLSGTFVQP